MLRLKSIEICNFRAIKHGTIRLDRYLTVLVGENASGKTAILDAIGYALTPLFAGALRGRSVVEFDDFRVEGLADPAGEITRVPIITLVTETDDEEWTIDFKLDHDGRRQNISGVLSGPVRNLPKEVARNEPGGAPIVVSYMADRGMPSKRSASAAANAKRHAGATGRAGGYIGALDSRAVFEEAVEWFEAIENLELRNNREIAGSYHDPRLEAVRRAIKKLVPGLCNPRMVGLPPRLMVDAVLPERPPESLSVDQLSGGYRAMLAIVMDLARRMAELNPDLPEPLSTGGIVMIDEIDLHLHPKWQQLVVNGLRTAFPQVQFILTTHSPQILTTLDPKNIRNLKWRDGKLLQEDVPSTSGAEAGRLLAEVMGVSERPPATISRFVDLLDRYRNIVLQEKWDSPEANTLLSELREASPDDPILGALNLERRRLSAQKRRAADEA
ncbi:AAA family ATPase [Komagataeibacter intermedius]|uniref:AAA+ ATPase domain-containing protein n=1 Tax=Komagataeibacter intermedius NRIC 0521 TaxID=1307934 RepID=A0ABQ0PH58_9PROT|nr:AAA family ATPase [Komagataeibacter intermedius]MCF3634928.1 AAA family ATPase [Komagataeibacter intermedius]GAN88483.1 hypothetical protein Gain_0207_014 [Komagataeibacter intermedius TF2]GBQ68625.1 hypothetical protein AA0521_1285 [Komagataeibacter intermedius NRIC 0521]